jgi:diguanylate cyclase (GGDEF)-like protein
MEQQPSADAHILIVDDSLRARLLVETLLRAQGYKHLTSVDSARQAFLALNLDAAPGAESAGFDLILMDLLMPEMDGIQACHQIKADPRFLDVPIIMVTAEESTESLKEAFDAGAIDYVNKPVNRVELLARVKSALRLKQETDCRKAREVELVELSEQLRKQSVVDGLTGIANRRNFDEELARIWRRAQRESAAVSLVLIDIDHFKRYNDHYGHVAGDDCLRRVAQALQHTVKRPFDLVARYGGEEFVVVLPDTSAPASARLAEEMRTAVELLDIPHAASTVSCRVTISSGVAAMFPTAGAQPEGLIAAADVCLYQAKTAGRNRVVIATHGHPRSKVADDDGSPPCRAVGVNGETHENSGG